VTRNSSASRWVFVRLAILGALVLLLPDLYIMHTGEPGQGDRRALCLHVAIAPCWSQTTCCCTWPGPSRGRKASAAGETPPQPEQATRGRHRASPLICLPDQQFLDVQRAGMNLAKPRDSSGRFTGKVIKCPSEANVSLTLLPRVSFARLSSHPLETR